MDDGEDVEDIFEDGLLTIFGDVTVAHGEPGKSFLYRSKAHGNIIVHLVNTDTFEERVHLFAHFVWNGAVLAADLIDRGEFPVAGKSVLELGAGAGLPGIISTLKSADIVVLSDYESPKVIENLRRNIQENIPKNLLPKVKVEGHIWGTNRGSITQHRERFDRIIAADCFWMSDQHQALVLTMSCLLEHTSSARILVIAGIHTKRSVVSAFFRIAELQGLIPDEEGIQEHNIMVGSTRPWRDDRGAEDTVERKQWLVVSKLKWSSL